MGQLASLEHLYLKDNRLTGPLPPSGANWPAWNISIWRTPADGALAPEWGQLASLEHLYLVDNQLRGPLPPEWGQLASLERLYLDDNR